MILDTFSAYLDFAIKSENSGLDFFAAREGKSDGRDAVAMRSFKAEAEKNIRLLRDTLRENVTELVMEPCAGIDDSGYLPQITESSCLACALDIVGKQRDFLRAAAKAVNLKEVRRIFEKLADKKDRLLLEFKQ